MAAPTAPTRPAVPAAPAKPAAPAAKATAPDELTEMKGDLAAISRALKCIGNCAFPGAMSGPVANTMQVLGSVEQELQKQVAMREQGATQKSASPAASPQSPGASGAAAPAQAGR